MKGSSPPERSRGVDLLATLPFRLAAGSDPDLRIFRTLLLLRPLKLVHDFGALDVLLDVIRTEAAAPRLHHAHVRGGSFFPPDSL